MEKTEKNVEENLTIYIEADRKEYFRCSMYYMRKYFGLREIILLTVLLAVALALFFLFANVFLLILFGVSVLIILIAFVLFLITSRGGYVLDVEKRGVYKQKLEFTEDALIVTNLDKAGTPVFIETHYYDKIDKISMKDSRIYIYAQASVFYYIIAKKYDRETCEKVVDFIKTHVSEKTLKMKNTYRIFPKKKKLTLEDGE